MKLTKYALSLGVLTAGTLTVATPSFAATTTAKATLSGEVLNPVTVREAADVKSASLGALKKGDKVTVYSTNKYGWVQIQYNDKKAYIYKDYVKVSDASKTTATKETTIKKTTSTAKTTTQYIQQPGANVRSKGNVKDSKILGKLTPGTKVAAYSTSKDGWVKISYNGGVGYVYKDYIGTKKPATTTTTKTPSKTTTATPAKTGYNLQVGKTYTYTLNGATVTLSSKGKKASGYTVWTMKDSKTKKSSKVYMKEVAGKGLFYKKAGEKAVQLLGYPYAVGDTYKNGSTTYKVAAVNVKVKTTAGTFTTVKVKAGNEVYYIAPTTGVVKVTKGSKTIFKLTAIK
jgi:uncharacterized protein YgiM (DUF1202 family)